MPGTQRLSGKRIVARGHLAQSAPIHSFIMVSFRALLSFNASVFILVKQYHMIKTIPLKFFKYLPVENDPSYSSFSKSS